MTQLSMKMGNTAAGRRLVRHGCVCRRTPVCLLLGRRQWWCWCGVGADGIGVGAPGVCAAPAGAFGGAADGTKPWDVS